MTKSSTHNKEIDEENYKNRKNHRELKRKNKLKRGSVIARESKSLSIDKKRIKGLFGKNSITNTLKEEEFFYSLDIKLPANRPGNDITDYTDLENHDLINSRSLNNMMPEEFALFDSIMQYIKFEWDYSNKLYNYCEWPTVDENMLELSERYPDCKFILYCKGEFFMDTYIVKIYINGSLEYSGSNVICKIEVELPDGSIKKTNSQGIVVLENGIDKMFTTKNKAINVKEQVNIATDLLVLLGQNVASIGTLFSEALLASKLLSSCFSIIDAMHQNFTRYGDNRGKRYHLNLRCKSILTNLQCIPPSSLNLGCVINLVNVMKDAIDLINKYDSKWRLTKFLASGTYQNMFDAANLNLSNFYYDFGLNYTINKKAFAIKTD
jgi:hypothetical protein